MMSTAILMAMGAEQSSKQATAHDVENFDGPTFAQTLDERVRIPPALPGKDCKVGTLPETSWERTGPTQIPVDSLDLTAGIKTKVFAGQLTPALIESKGTHVAKAAALQPSLTAGTKVHKKTEETETQVAETVGDTEESQRETPAVAQVAQSANLLIEGAMPLEQTEGDQILLPRIQIPMSQREALATGMTQEAAPEKETAEKTPAGEAIQSAVTAKGREVMVPPVADETKSTHGVGVQVVAHALNPIPAHAAAASELPDAMSVATSNVALNAESGKSAVGPGPTSSSRSTSSGVAPAFTDGSGSSKSAAHGAKTSVSDRETTPAVPGDPAAPSMPDAKVERSQAAAANAGGDSDMKGRTMGDAPVAAVHALASGGEVTGGLAAPVITGLTRWSGGEAGTSIVGSANGLREQGGSGSVAQSMEPMPRTLSATPTALEVGIPDGTHGWLKVRAEMADGGVVNASVSAASPSSQEMLHRELPSLTAYLQSEKVAVNTVVVHPTASVGAESRGNSAGPESGGSGQAPWQNHEGGQQKSSVKTAAEVTEDVTSYQGLHGVGEDGMSPLGSYGSGGSWLSIRA